MEKKAWLICICCLCCMCGVSAPKKNNFSVKRGVNISHWLSFLRRLMLNFCQK